MQKRKATGSPGAARTATVAIQLDTCIRNGLNGICAGHRRDHYRATAFHNHNLMRDAFDGVCSVIARDVLVIVMLPPAVSSLFSPPAPPNCDQHPKPITSSAKHLHYAPNKRLQNHDSGLHAFEHACHVDCRDSGARTPEMRLQTHTRYTRMCTTLTYIGLPATLS